MNMHITIRSGTSAVGCKSACQPNKAEMMIWNRVTTKPSPPNQWKLD